MADADVKIEHLLDSQNFGQWITKINEIVDAYNKIYDTTMNNNVVITKATQAGQVGDILPTEAPKASYDDYVTNGVYYVPSTTTECPKDNTVANNLYVATNDSSITQFIVSIEENPRFFIRCKPRDEVAFSSWYLIPTKSINDMTYLKLTGGKIVSAVDGSGGSLEVERNLKTSNLNVTNVTTLNGNIEIQDVTKKDISLSIKTEQNNTIFNVNGNPVQIAFYIQDNDTVTTDKEGKKISYYIIDNTFITYENVYYIQRNKDTINPKADGTGDPFYIQENGYITNNKDGTGVKFFMDKNLVYNVNSDGSKELYRYVLNDVLYSFNTIYFLRNNAFYTLNDAGQLTLKYHVEEVLNSDTETTHLGVVGYQTVAYLQNDPNFQNSIYITVTEDEAGTKVLYYIKNNVYYSDPEYLNPVLYVVDDKVCVDPNGENILYYIRGDKITTRDVFYYIKDDVVYPNTMYKNPVYYIANDSVISLVDKKYFIQYALDTITTDKKGVSTVFYIQKDNTITKDYEGNDIRYYLNSSTVTKDISGSEVEYYIKDDVLRTQSIEYYIQLDNTITSDKEGLSVHFYKSGNQILKQTTPLIIDMKENVGNINGSAEQAFFLKKTGLTDSYIGKELNKAASGQAIFDLYNYTNRVYMPYAGGIFDGLVVHRGDIRMDVTNEGKQTKILSYGDLDFECTKTVSFATNNDWGELYIDRHNEPTTKDIPCIFGARTRTGMSANVIGEPLYALGSLEFTEDSTTLRLRKTNLTKVIDNEEKTNIALVLERDAFRPSVDRVISLGTGAMRYSNIYSAEGSEISSSDETLMTDIARIDDVILDKWKDLDWTTFRYRNCVEEKGDTARVHTGLVAQDVKEVLKDIDVTKYGFFCYDKWNDIYETQYITIPEQKDAYGNVLAPEYTETITTLKKKGGEQYSLRYQEVQAIENAYLRKEIQGLRSEIEELKKLINK